MSEDWYKGGYDADFGGSGGGAAKNRFYLPLNKETDVTFVDDETKPFEVTVGDTKRAIKLPFCFKEHQLKVGGNWRNWYTCLRPMGQVCPICEGGNNCAKVGVYTVIDHSEWKDRNGNTHKDEVRLFVVKMSSTTWKVLEKFSKKLGGLRGAKFHVERLGEKTSSVGDQFALIHKVDLDPKIQPFNYLDIFKPKAAADLKSVLGNVAAEEDEPVPFD